MGQDRKENILEGEVTPTKSSDTYIAETVERIRSEIEDVGEVVDVSIHKPRFLEQRETPKDVTVAQPEAAADPVSIHAVQARERRIRGLRRKAA